MNQQNLSSRPIAARSAASWHSPPFRADGGGSEPAAGALAEIVVTARKREESLQETPISVTAFTAEGLAQRGIESTKDLGNFTPNLVANNGSAVSGNNSAGSTSSAASARSTSRSTRIQASGSTWMRSTSRAPWAR